ncbi:Type II toxin-antitoxin system VapC family toxin (plasmid) [Candidatus Trichorickettsia mobilis]|uniref:type II toxin-antitoxin system VapC family toxin n=1 Tax=Candidatus Trichorickettsia mobilis TaxID=1346319 RepID=UPI002B257824|nr:type II toxin-antitoxin system VapC family toxin [Candidatus Trichorickettsia mobilis]WPY01919.1 Type II toxin-antitoxin system VapC family toxin [Candidatus Trichorickettsia mobilis]
MINIPAQNEKLVLDTHILVWYAEGIHLTTIQIESIENFRKKDNLYISAISIWEIALLVSKGKIIFSVTLTEWVDKLLSLPGLNIIDLSVPVLLESCNLPNYQHKDPADRLIIASVRLNNFYLLTVDQNITEYGKSGYLKILDANLIPPTTSL